MHRVYSGLSLVLTFLVCMPLFYLSEKYHLGFLQPIAGMAFLGGLFVSIFTVREVVFRMREQETLTFRNAVAHTFNGYVLKLCFLPLIGPWIERAFIAEKPKSPFLGDDETE